MARLRTIPALPEPTRPGASRAALAALQRQALRELDSSGGEGSAVRLYVSAATGGREHLATASDSTAYRAAVRTGALPSRREVGRFAHRKRWMASAAKLALAGGIRQIAVLGAGFDTLGLNLRHADPELLVVELDRPAMIEEKGLALAAAKIAPPWPCLVAIDLGDTRALAQSLAAAGWHASEPALFVAELVLEYLEPEAAFAVLCAVGTLSGPESRLACTIRFGDVEGDQLAAATAAAGEPMRFRPLSNELPALLARAGLDVLATRGRVLGPGAVAALLFLAPAKTPQATGTAE